MPSYWPAPIRVALGWCGICGEHLSNRGFAARCRPKHADWRYQHQITGQPETPQHHTDPLKYPELGETVTWITYELEPPTGRTWRETVTYPTPPEQPWPEPAGNPQTTPREYPKLQESRS